MYDITIHRDINKSIINFPSEQILAVFYSIIKKYNQLHNFERLKLTKSELWNMTGLSENKYNSVKISELIKKLTESNTFKISENISISGSIFIIEEKENDIFIEIPYTYQQYIYNSKDIKMIDKNKKKLKMNPLELDYFKEEIQKKNKAKENILLLKQADILNIQGKYNKRLYTVLMMKKIGNEGKLIENYSKFKRLLEIPDSYVQGMIDKRFLHKENLELKKAGINITRIEKNREGGKEIKTIEIYFSYTEINKTKLKLFNDIDLNIEKNKEEIESKNQSDNEINNIILNITKIDQELFEKYYEELPKALKIIQKEKHLKEWIKQKYFSEYD